MDKLQNWFYIILAVFVALAANSISAIWAGKESKLNPWLLALLFVSPFVYITFGLVTSKLGLTRASGTIDSLLTISTILVGIVLFQEWNSLSFYHYVGIFLATTGIIIINFS